MGVERFHESDEDPGQEAGADLPKDADSPRGAGHSGETARPGDVARPEEPAQDNSPRDSSSRADVAEKPAETRTRSEYADHVAPPGSPPIEDDSPKREIGDTSSRTNERHEEMQSGQRDTEESDSAREPDEQGAEQPWDEEKPESNDSTADGGAQRSPDDPAVETAHADSESTTLNSESEEAPDDAETDSGLNADSETDDVLERDPHDARQPAADDPDSPLADAPSSQGADGGTDTEPDSTPPPEPNEESPPEESLATEETSEIDEPTRRLTDREWAEHLAEVRRTLDRAREEGLESHLVNTIDPDHQSWTKERRELHNSILNDLYSAATDIPNMGHALVAGGLGGAGKTTVLTEQAGIDTSQYLVINPDNLKEEMARRGMTPEIEGLSPMEASDLVHEESSYLARQLALRAYNDRKNVIWDITMSDEKRTAARLDEMRNAGYSRIDGLFVDIPVETSVKRTESRHRDGHEKFLAGHGLGGRPVPPKVIRDQADPEWGSKNRRTFNNLRSRFDNWSIYDNSVDWKPALIIDSSRKGSVD
jgi:zeta toxin